MLFDRKTVDADNVIVVVVVVTMVVAVGVVVVVLGGGGGRGGGGRVVVGVAGKQYEKPQAPGAAAIATLLRSSIITMAHYSR